MKTPVTAERIIIRTEINAEAWAKFQAYVERVGMTQFAAVGRALEFFATLDDTSQAVAMGHIPPDLVPDAARLALVRMSERDLAADLLEA